MLPGLRLVRASHRAFLVLIALLILASSPAVAIAADQPLAGHWEGAIEIPGKALGFDVDFSINTDGSWKGDVTILAQGARDLPLAKIAVEPPNVSFELPGIPGDPAFRGKFEAGHKTIKGTFTQGGKSFPFQLKAGVDRVAAAKTSLIGFDSFVTEAIKAWDVPGLAMAIVKDGQVIFVQGFGFRDVDGKLPVTPKTLFAIGSCSKAFTTFVLGTLVDEGKLDWDAPVRNYIPEFRMHDRVATELMTPRDLVTHRSGLPRHDLVWYNSTISRKQVVDRLRYLEPSETFRSKFQYNNLMFVTAGYLVERVTGKSWEEAVRLRIFEPLGMTGSNFSVRDSQKSADFARPYAERDDKVVEVPFRDISNVGPAGSINSNVEDISRWLMVNTQKGIFGSKPAISAAVLADIHSSHMTTGALPQRPEIAPVGYGLGWSVDDYRGHRRISHGGGIDGFTTMTTLFPEDGLGLIAFANLSGTALPELATRHAADRLLGLSTIDWSGEELGKKAKSKAAAKEAKSKKDTVRRPGTTPAHPLEEYAGEYENPGYGVIKVELRNGKLDIAYNGIEAPLAHWHYEVFSALKNPKDPAFEDQKVQFQTNLKGYVESLSVPFEPSIKPIVFMIKPDAKLSDPTYLKRFTGEFELAGITMSVQLEGNTLVLGSQGQGSQALIPVRNDTFQVKGQSEVSVRFVTDKDSKVGEIALERPGGVFTAKRKAK
jgi:CubicO group peptidase (beta-lactamase class C family)